MTYCQNCGSQAYRNVYPNWKKILTQKAGGQLPPPPPPPPPPQQQPQRQAQPRYQPPAPKKSLLPIIAGVVVVVIVIAVIAGVLLLGDGLGGGGNGGGGTGGASTPEKTFDKFVDEIDSGDIENALKYTDAVFLSQEDYDEFLNGMEGEMGDVNVKVNSVDVKNKEDLPSSDVDDMEEAISEFEEELNITVEDWCIVEFSITISANGDTETTESSFPCIKVDGKWYIAIYAFGMSSGGGDTEGTSSPENAINTFVDKINSGDIEGALEYTDAAFLPQEEYYELLDGMEEEMGDVDIEVNSINIKEKEDLSSDEVEDNENSISEHEEELGITVEDWCMLEFSITMSKDGDSEITEGSFLCIKVDGKWYIAMYAIGMPSGGSSTPAGSWTNVEVIGNNSGKLTFGAFTQDVAPMDIRLIVTDGVMTYQITWPSAPMSQTTDLMVMPGLFTATYFDYNYQGNLVNSGDYITLTGLMQNTFYTFEVFYIPTDSTIAMTGAPGDFTTPP